MNKPYRGNGGLVTRLLGRLEVFHGDGVVEFRLRSESEIEKRGAVVIMRIEGLPDIPRLEDGMSILVMAKSDGVTFTKESYEVSPTGRERRKGVA